MHQRFSILRRLGAPGFCSLGLLLGAVAQAQAASGPETLDVATFTAPPGWAREPIEGSGLKFAKISGNTYCILGLYQSSESQGNLTADFKDQWAELVARELNPPKAPQTRTGVTRNGWQSMSGNANYTLGVNQGLAILNTFSDLRRRLSVLLLTNSNACTADLTTFLAGLSLEPGVGGSASAAPVVLTPASTANLPTTRYTYSTNRFADGWLASVQRDWVQVDKTATATTVRLHYATPYTPQTREMDVQARAEYFWNALLGSRFTPGTLKLSQSGTGASQMVLAESDATEVGTGKRVHVALLLTTETGVIRATEAVTPDQASFSQQFPTLQKLQAMQNYNKFAVDITDLTGTWANSAGVYSLYFPGLTGGVTGMRSAANYDQFNFLLNGTYQYQNIGGTLKSSGKFKLSGWELVITDQQNRANTYAIQYEAVRGGRMLHLQNKQSSSLHYHLLRTK